jgi:hypothetical protein
MQLKRIVLFVLAAAVFMGLVGIAVACLVAANKVYNASGQWVARATYVGQCVPRAVPPMTAAQCATLSHTAILKSPNGVRLPNGLQITDKDVLLAGFSALNNTGSALISLFGGIVGLIGVVIALGSLILARQSN